MLEGVVVPTAVAWPTSEAAVVGGAHCPRVIELGGHGHCHVLDGHNGRSHNLVR